MDFSKPELEVLVEALEWAIPTYRAAVVNSPEAEGQIIVRRQHALALIARLNDMRESTEYAVNLGASLKRVTNDLAKIRQRLG